MKIVLGIDPGLASTGYGLIRMENNRLAYIDHGVIVTSADSPRGQRLVQIHQSVNALLRRHCPDEAGIEQLYFARNITSALPVAQALGVVVLALTQAGVPVSEYSPVTIKSSIVGHGRATKVQVQEMARVLLGLTELPAPSHAADALATAICHCHWRHSADMELSGVQ